MKNRFYICILFLMILLSIMIPISSSYKIFSNKIIYFDDVGNADNISIWDVIDNEYEKYESSLKLKESAYESVAFDLYIGFIYNLTYKEEEIFPDVILKGYEFQCLRVLLLCWDVLFGFEIYSLNNGDSREIIEVYVDGLEVYYTGYITENFICVLQIIKDV